MIRLENISKKYIICHEKQALVRNIFSFLRTKHYQEFWALRDINLTLATGTCLGVIGRNGSGKTTLLNIISGITVPEKGRIVVEGGVSTLLTLGAGFHPELTGEENIYLNGTIVGMTMTQIRSHFKRIVDFCELRDFIDAPLRTYSSGMKVRLGFAIAIHAHFDILLIDEILSVGDIAFQEKCLDRMNEFRRQGKTILFVSQSLNTIREFCDEAILMEGGRVLCRGATDHVIQRYQDMMNMKPDRADSQSEANKSEAINKNTFSLKTAEVRDEYNYSQPYGRPSTIVDINRSKEDIGKVTNESEITKVVFSDSRGVKKTIFSTGEKMRIVVNFSVKKEICDPHFGIAIFQDNGVYCFGPNTRFDGIKIEKLKIGKGQFSIEYKSLNLLPGKYFVSVAILEKDEKFAYDLHYARYHFEVISHKQDHGVCFLEHRWQWSLLR